MSGLKYLVVVLLVESTRSYPHNQRHVRSPNLQVQPSHSYPYPYPYQPALPYQSGYGLQTLPVDPSQAYQSQQQNPWMIIPSYPSYGNSYPGSGYPGSGYPGSGYPSYASNPSYPSYPFQPSYPYQQNFQNYPDPFAHVPTEIIDVDEDGTFDLGFALEESLPKVEITSSHHSTSSGASNKPLRPANSQIVESKPIQATISRIFDSKSSEPTVDVTYAGTDSQLGSGVLIEATGSSENKSGEEKTGTDNQEEKKEEGEEEEQKGEKEDKDNQGLFPWG